jgi:hypothetical protein
MEIKEFLKTGILNGVGRGMHLSEVLKYFPNITFSEEPDNIKISNSEYFEFTLWNDFVLGMVISVIAFEPIVVEKRAHRNLQLRVKTTFDQVRKMLQELGIAWKILPQLTFENQLVMQTEGGVDFVFGYSEHRSMLCKIGCWQR